MRNRVIHMAGPDVGPLEASIVADAVANGWYAPEAYKYVEMFENEFANWHGRRFGLMTPNCTSAIHLVLEGLGIGVGDEVVAPESTWIGSTAGIAHAGAETVFADIDRRNWCVSRETVLARVTPRTRAVIAVDLYGNMPRWDELEAFSGETGIPVIEDAAEALGSRFQNRKAGNFGIASVFSFHRTKTLTTGEGGMLLLDDEDLYRRCAFLRDHGRAPGTYLNTEVAFKYMPSNLAAALGHGQFLRIDELLENKRHTFLRFRDNFRHLPQLQLNEESSDVHNGAWATAVVFSEKLGLTSDQVIEALGKKSIPVRPFFYPLSSLPAYADNRTGGPEVNPVAYHCSQFGIHLPCSMNLTDDDMDYISDAVIALVEHDDSYA
jgi:perosamine synthetase